MACCGDAADKELKAKNKQIEKTINADRTKQQKSVNLLLLGAGDSGKSTIAKQMKIIHLNGFTEEERKEWSPIVFKNTIYSMRIVIRKAFDFGYQLLPENQPYSARLLDKEDPLFGSFTVEVTQENAPILKALCADPAIKQTYARSAEYQLNDSAGFFFDSIDRLASPDYLPTEQDVLMARIKTTGIHEIFFEIDNIFFNMVDVGGQRSERRKWIHCFEGVTAVLFCGAISAYNQRLFEDHTVNRMHESLQLFGDICNGPWFKATPLILFLNKKDIFEQKIKTVPLTVCFPEYTGPNDMQSTTTFITKKFSERKASQELFVHITCATDTNNITIVFNAVKTIILQKVFHEIGLPV